MLCPWYYKHEHCEGAEYSGKPATIDLGDLAALMVPGLNL